MRELLLVVVLGCGAATDPPVEACAPAPEGFTVGRSGQYVQVTRRLEPEPRPGGVRLYSEARVVETLPGAVDFGDVRLEVREDMTLCLLDG